jgi:hypothetical protein
VEDLGLGLFATRDTAPEWTVNGLASLFLKVLDSSEASEKIRKEARRIGGIQDDMLLLGRFSNWSHLAMPKAKVSLTLLTSSPVPVFVLPVWRLRGSPH